MCTKFWSPKQLFTPIEAQLNLNSYTLSWALAFTISELVFAYTFSGVWKLAKMYNFVGLHQDFLDNNLSWLLLNPLKRVGIFTILDPELES